MTRKILNIKLANLAKLMGKEVGFGPGQWHLDYASCYGGYMVVCRDAGGGENHPLLSRRLKLKDMDLALDMAIAVKRLEGYEAREKERGSQ